MFKDVLLITMMYTFKEIITTVEINYVTYSINNDWRV